MCLLKTHLFLLFGRARAPLYDPPDFAFVTIPERELGAEDCLTLQPSPLPNEHVVEISMKTLFVNVEYLATQIQAGGAV